MEKKLGALTNVQQSKMDQVVFQDRGIIVESENGIVNASLKQQFENLNKLFFSVGITESEDEILDLSELKAKEDSLESDDEPVETKGESKDES